MSFTGIPVFFHKYSGILVVFRYLGKSCDRKCMHLTVKELITTTADKTLIFFFSNQIKLDISCEIICLVEDLHEMLSLIFSLKNKKINYACCLLQTCLML